MKMKHNPPKSPDLPRRRFLQGVAAGGVLLGLSPRWLRAAASAEAIDTGTVPVLSGTEFDLTIAETPVNFTGVPGIATTINGSIPGPILRWREGDTVTLRVTNRLKTASSIHWHGILLPFRMDGVPGISYPGIGPGETFVYRFKVGQSGTYWYHSHSGFQEQTGMYGAIVIDPAGRDPKRADRDYVVQLSDWTDEDPMRVFARLKKHSDYYNFRQPTVGEFLRDVSADGLGAALAARRMWNRMRMSPADLADVSGYTYTYLMNGATPAGNWTALFRRGERVRLRFINSGAMTFFDVRIPGLEMTVVQTDGQNVEPVTVDEIRIGVAETYDVIVEPRDDRAYTIFAQSMDRTGFACGTLAPRTGMRAEAPALDAPQRLTMADMMGAMSHANMSGMQGMGSMNHGAHDMAGGMDMSGMDDGPACITAPTPWAVERPRVIPRSALTTRGPNMALASTCASTTPGPIWTIPASACGATVGGCSPMRICTPSAVHSTGAMRSGRSSCISPATWSVTAGRWTGSSSAGPRRCTSVPTSACAWCSSTTP